jgi:hypothetical protein
MMMEVSQVTMDLAVNQSNLNIDIFFTNPSFSYSQLAKI